MAEEWFKAAQVADVNSLIHLINNDPLILGKVALLGFESPLHIACNAGHLDLVKNVLKWRKEFAAELNRDGFSSLHIASANGCTEIVKELLKVDNNLCLLKGREGRIPLHHASASGRVSIIKELLSTKPNSINILTARGETSLHLAVKNNQFEAFKVLLDRIKRFKKENVLNKRDGQGCTILHLAVLGKQYEVVNLLLKGHDVWTRSIPALVVNSLDEKGLTPLDISLLFQNTEMHDGEIEEILRQAGAMRSKDLENGVFNHNNTTRTQASLKPGLPPNKFFKYDRNRDSPSEVRNCLLVISVLIATATYQAVLSPPGGVWQDNHLSANSSNSNTTITPGDIGQGNYLSVNNSIGHNTINFFNTTGNDNTNNNTPFHKAGQSVLGSQSPIWYSLFLVSNSLGFYMSLYMIVWLTHAFPLHFELLVSLFAILATYHVSMITISPTDGFALFFFSLTVFTSMLSIIRWFYLKFQVDELPSTHQATACG